MWLAIAFCTPEFTDVTGQSRILNAITDFFAQAIRKKIADIVLTPLIYQRRPDIGEEARMATVGNYVILFRILDNVVRIDCIAYGARSLSSVFDPS